MRVQGALDQFAHRLRHDRQRGQLIPERELPLPHVPREVEVANVRAADGGPLTPDFVSVAGGDVTDTPSSPPSKCGTASSLAQQLVSVKRTYRLSKASQALFSRKGAILFGGDVEEFESVLIADRTASGPAVRVQDALD